MHVVDEFADIPPADQSPGFDWQDLGDTLSAIAAIGQFDPQPDLPNLGPSREIGRV